MAIFEGNEWAPYQMIYTLRTKTRRMHSAKSRTFAVSRSIHYGLFLVFEGIRFYVKKDRTKTKLVFVNADLNVKRFREGMSFNLSQEQQHLVPSQEQVFELFLDFLRHPRMRPFLRKMSKAGSQGYLRPFTLDDEQSIGVTFPNNPVIRVVASRYKSYLGEPFHGVVIPHMVRAVGINGTGRLKLGTNYLLSVRAVAEAKKILPGAESALFLDDKPDAPLRDRKVTEWDSSCCLIALKNGTVIKIPESSLVLPSVTIKGIVRILEELDVPVEERDVTYGELTDLVTDHQVVTLCSVGTAGILNRCSSLLLVDNDKNRLGLMESDRSHQLFEKLAEAKQYYWETYKGTVKTPKGLNRVEYEMGA